MITPNQQFLDIFRNTNGALGVGEAIAIMNLAAQCPKGNWLEMGCYMGKSAQAAIIGGNCWQFELIEPEFGKTISVEDFAKMVGEATGKGVRLVFLQGYSTDYLSSTNHLFSYVMVDSGSHQDGLPIAEAKLLEERMLPGGIIVWHDWNSQFHEVKEATEYLVSTGKYEYVPIPWDEINAYVTENKLEDGNVSWHHNELYCPNFVGAVKRK